MRVGWRPQSWPKGPFVKDVRTKGGRGVGQKGDIVWEVAWIYYCRCGQNADKGGGGPKSRKFCGHSLWMAPNTPPGVLRPHIKCPYPTATAVDGKGFMRDTSSFPHSQCFLRTWRLIPNFQMFYFVAEKEFLMLHVMLHNIFKGMQWKFSD